jgi:catecholate siderophore receptor
LSDSPHFKNEWSILMRDLKPSNEISLRKANLMTKPLVGLSTAAACFVGTAYAQGTGSSNLIVLPTVDVETTQVQTPAPKRSTSAANSAAAQRAEAARKKALAAERARAEAAAAEARAQAEAAAAAQRAEAARRAQAGSNPFADPNAPLRAVNIGNSLYQGPLLETPRTVTVATEEYLNATNTTSIRELARSTPGVSLGYGEGGASFGDNLYIRGFRANNDVYVDGVRDSGLAVRETFNVEQVEVIKGPVGATEGRGAAGGALNLTTKRPQDVDFQRTTTEISGAGTVRTTLDYNWAQSEKLQFRVNAMLQDGKVAGRGDEVHDNRQGVSAALTYHVNDDVTVDLDYTHTRFDQMPDWGVGYITDPDDTDGVVIPNGPITEFGVPRDTFYGIKGRDFQEFEQDGVSARLTWDIAPNLTLTNTFRAVQSDNAYIATAPSRVNDNGSADPADWTIGTSVKSRFQETEIFSNTTELAGNANLFGLNHDFVVGVMMQSESLQRGSYTDLQSEDFPAGDTGCTMPALNPDPSQCWNGSAPVRGDVTAKVDVDTFSLYMADRFKPSENLIIDAGLRVDQYEMTNVGEGRTGPYSYSREDTMLNGNLGMTYLLKDNWTVYGAFATSTNPMGSELEGGGGIYGGLDDAGQIFDPERNVALEFGTKYQVNNHLELTASLFQTTRLKGRETYDADGRGGNPGVTDDTLQYRFTGLELGVAGRIKDRIGLYGGAMFMDSEITKSMDPNAVGQNVAGIVHQQLNLLVTYDLTDALTLGAQLNWAGDVELGTTAPNGNILPSYTSLDLVGSYAISENADLRFGVKNAANATYYDTAYRSGEPFSYVAPGREIWAAIDIQF